MHRPSPTRTCPVRIMENAEGAPTPGSALGRDGPSSTGDQPAAVALKCHTPAGPGGVGNSDRTRKNARPTAIGGQERERWNYNDFRTVIRAQAQPQPRRGERFAAPVGTTPDHPAVYTKVRKMGL